MDDQETQPELPQTTTAPKVATNPTPKPRGRPKGSGKKAQFAMKRAERVTVTANMSKSASGKTSTATSAPDLDAGPPPVSAPVPHAAPLVPSAPPHKEPDMAAAKTITGDFDLASFEYNVTQRGGIPPDGLLGYQVKRRMQDGRTWQTEPAREGLYTVQAHPDAVVQLEHEMSSWGMQPGWIALNFHPVNQPSKTIWRWEIPVGGATTMAQQQSPVLYQPPQAPQVYQPQPPPQQAQPPMQYPPYQPQPIHVQVGPQPMQHQPAHAMAPVFDGYGRQIDPRSLLGFSPPGPPTYDPRWSMPQPPAPTPSPPGPAAPDPELALLRAELAELKRERAEDRKRQEEKDRAAEMKADRDFLLARIEKAAADSDARFAALVTRLDAAPKQTTTDQLLALAPLLLPHLVTMRKDAADAEQAARDREQKMWSMMMERRTDPMVEKVLADLRSLQEKNEKNKDPNEQILIAQTVSQALFGSFSMSMKMFEQMSSMMPEASPLKEMLGEFMQGAKGILESYGTSKRLEAERAARQAAQQHTHTATIAPGAAAAPPAPPPTFDLRTRDGMLGYMRAQGAPDDWCTKGWAAIVSSLVRREDPDAVGEALAATCYALWKTDSLPEALVLLEDPEAFQKPWPLVLSFLPLGEQNEETKRYLDAVLAAAEHHYRVARGGEPGEVEGEAEEADSEDGASGSNGAAPADDGVVPAVPTNAAA